MRAKYFFSIALLLCGSLLIGGSLNVLAQNGRDRFGLDVQNGNNTFDPFNNTPTEDSTDLKKKSTDWDEEPAIIHYKYLNSDIAREYDSSILFFHRNQYQQPVWYQDLGNWGSVAQQRLFQPYSKAQLRIGNDNWNMYKYTLDSVPFIHTTRPYTSFSFMLGSKQMQWVEFLHTQNINPRSNFAFKIANNSSDGFFSRQKASGVNAFITANHKSENERHQMYLALIMNNFKQDENGGILDESHLSESRYTNRSAIPTVIEGIRAGNSPVHNRSTDIQGYLENSYAWGQTDTIYTADSTGYEYQFIPRFSIKHVLDIYSNRHKYVDALPEPHYYAFYDNLNFSSGDTVFGMPKHTAVDNRFTLNTFIGKKEQMLNLEAGAGIRFDQFKTRFVNNDTAAIRDTGVIRNTGAYLYGQLRKDALKDNQWSYHARTIFFLTGEQTIGNLTLEGELSKSFSKLGSIVIGAQQHIVSPSYQQQFFKTNVFEINNDFNKTAITGIYGKLDIPKINLSVRLDNKLITNYIYLNQDLAFAQLDASFSVLQLSGRKLFKWGSFYLDNEVVWQQIAGDAPLHLPALMLRHQLAYKWSMFANKLHTFVGVEARYHTDYKADAYSFVHNQFYYQDNYTLSNSPALSLFFNFKVQRLRIFLLGDQLQQLWQTQNLMAAPGYAMPNAHIRFGFNWLMMN